MNSSPFLPFFHFGSQKQWAMGMLLLSWDKKDKPLEGMFCSLGQ